MTYLVVTILNLSQGLGAYSISKTALLGLTKVLAIECAQMGVRVNCVAPGIIKTRFSEAVSGNFSYFVIVLPNKIIIRVKFPKFDWKVKCVNNKMLEYDWFLTAHIYSLILLCNSKTVRFDLSDY